MALSSIAPYLQFIFIYKVYQAVKSDIPHNYIILLIGTIFVVDTMRFQEETEIMCGFS